MNRQFDVVIMGTGIAGLSAALELSKHWRVALISKSKLVSSASAYAQGGIAAVFDQADSVDAHVQDTLNAGAGLCQADTVKSVVADGPAAAHWLIDQGVDFTQADGAYHLNREGGHTQRRILHVADSTGHSIIAQLIARVKQSDKITLFEHTIAVDLVKQAGRCVGVYLLDVKRSQVFALAAHAVVLATGGASRAYLYSTNDAVASGDGIAIAWRAGARVANMEFNQFHPTCLYHPEAGSFLISEALRGEGAHLVLRDGTRFMPAFDARAELAPRDIVARAIDYEMKRLGLDNVFLDISHRGADFIRSHFPMIHERCLRFGYDMTVEPIPVVPAAHYTCGGVMVNARGQTDCPGLFACGEVTYTGLHGANRLASNSLLECVVYAHRVSVAIHEQLGGGRFDFASIAPWDESQVTDSPEEIYVSCNWEEIRRCMWNYMGIVRSDQRLRRAMDRIRLLRREIREYYGHFRVTRDLLELRNLVVVAELMVRSAALRQESRGLHYTIDYPNAVSGNSAPTILVPDNAFRVQADAVECGALL